MAVKDHLVETKLFTLKCSCGARSTVENCNTRTEAAREYKVRGWTSIADDLMCPKCTKRYHI